jgi:hypothetical protein
MQIDKSIILKHLARHAMERAFKAQNLSRNEPECLIGCTAYVFGVNPQVPEKCNFCNELVTFKHQINRHFMIQHLYYLYGGLCSGQYSQRSRNNNDSISVSIFVLSSQVRLANWRNYRAKVLGDVYYILHSMSSVSHNKSTFIRLNNCCMSLWAKEAVTVYSEWVKECTQW